MEIRFITPADNRQEISRVYEESWKFAYKGIIPQDYLDGIPKKQWVSNLDSGGRQTLICIEEGNIVGTTSFGRSRFARFDQWGEIISIYFLPEYMGRGYGKALLKAAISELKKMGYSKVFLWVLEENQRARDFYEAMGFIPADEYLDDNIGGKDLREVQYIYEENICAE